MTANEERLMALMLARATEGLSASEQQELEQLLDEAGVRDTDDLELAMAATMNAFAMQTASALPVPEALERRIVADAEGYFASVERGNRVTDIAGARRRLRSRKPGTGRPRVPAWHKLGWATAAMLLVALIFVGRPGPGDVGRVSNPIAARAELLRSAPGTLVIPWSRSEFADYDGVSGDVVWNDDLQQGYLRLAGMPVNDPAASQYQLWIVDPDRDTHPVDGGVFDIPAGAAEVVIPIDAKLTVSAPRVFAITREQPGGVVVSEGPLLVVASAG